MTINLSDLVFGVLPSMRRDEWRHSNLSLIGGNGDVKLLSPRCCTQTQSSISVIYLYSSVQCVYLDVCEAERACVSAQTQQVWNEWGRRGRAWTSFMRCGEISRWQSREAGTKTQREGEFVSVCLTDWQTDRQADRQVGCCRTADSTLTPIGLYSGGGSWTGAATRSPEQEPHSDTPTPGRGERTMGSASSSYRVIYLDVDGRIQKVRPVYFMETVCQRCQSESKWRKEKQGLVSW